MKWILLRSFITVLIVIGSSTVFSQQKIWNIADCIEQGWKANINVQQTILNKISAEKDVELNKAQYHPSLNASYTNGFNWGRSIDPTSYQYVNGLVNTNNINVSASLTLFDGFMTPNRIKQSKLGLKLADGQLDQQKNLIAITISAAYLQTLLAYENVDLISQQLTASRELLSNTQKFYEKGLKSEGELLLVRSQVAKEESDSMQAANTLQLAKLSLSQLMEIPYSSNFNVERFNPEFSEKFIAFPFPSSKILYDSAVVRLPEINNAILNAEINEYELKVNKGNYYPRLSVNGSIGSNYASTSRLITQDIQINDEPIGYLYSTPTELIYGPQVTVTPITSNYAYFDQLGDNMNSSVSVVLSIPIYNKRSTKLTSDKIIVNIEKANLELMNQENLLRKDIESDYLEYQLLYNQHKASRLKLQAYSASYQKIVKQFNLQLASGYELLLEKNKIAAAQSEIAQLQYQLIFKYIILRYYQSGVVELPVQY